MTRATFKHLIAAVVLAAVAAPAPAQQYSGGFKFIEAVKKRKGKEAEELLSGGGGGLINSRDGDGDAALHILARGRDYTWLSFMLGKGARVDLPDRNGNTALAIAAQIGWLEGAQLLLSRRAQANAQNGRGETPLILAVHARDLPMVRLLLQAGANPKHTDSVAGYSALDYAKRDTRSGPIVKALEAPTQAAKPVMGPTL